MWEKMAELYLGIMQPSGLRFAYSLAYPAYNIVAPEDTSAVKGLLEVRAVS